MHCDTLTVCADGDKTLRSCRLQCSLEKLHESNCAAQCFAVFTQGNGAARAFERYVRFFEKSIKENADIAAVVRCGGDLRRAAEAGRTGCILTVENLGFLEDIAGGIARLAALGVRMASLVWNKENGLAYPNLVLCDGAPRLDLRQSRGLKPRGREAAEALDAHGIVIDISHLSDGGAEELLEGRKTPVVASHSNAAAVCGVSRNLTDALIAKIADCGGVVGVNFCRDFLGGDGGFASVAAHVRHLIGVGGEDVIALGSDFDGIPQNAQLGGCERVPALFKYLGRAGIPARVLEKLAFANFYRVFAEVCGE